MRSVSCGKCFLWKVFLCLAAMAWLFFFFWLVWPIPTLSSVGPFLVVINIPGSPKQVRYELLSGPTLGVLQRFNSRPGSQKISIRTTPGTRLELRLRAVDPDSGLGSPLSDPRIINVPQPRPSESLTQLWNLLVDMHVHHQKYFCCATLSPSYLIGLEPAEPN